MTFTHFREWGRNRKINRQVEILQRLSPFIHSPNDPSPRANCLSEPKEQPSRAPFLRAPPEDVPRRRETSKQQGRRGNREGLLKRRGSRNPVGVVRFSYVQLCRQTSPTLGCDIILKMVCVCVWWAWKIAARIVPGLSFPPRIWICLFVCFVVICECVFVGFLVSFSE